jgi:hypothetical protein
MDDSGVDAALSARKKLNTGEDEPIPSTSHGSPSSSGLSATAGTAAGRVLHASPSSGSSGMATYKRGRLPHGESEVIDEEADTFEEFHEGGDQHKAVAYLDSLLTFMSGPPKNGLTLVASTSSLSSTSNALASSSSSTLGSSVSTTTGSNTTSSGTESLKSYRSRVVLAPISDTSSRSVVAGTSSPSSGLSSITGARPLTIVASSSSSSTTSSTAASTMSTTTATSGSNKAAPMVIAGTASIKAKQRRVAAAATSSDLTVIPTAKPPAPSPLAASVSAPPSSSSSTSSPQRKEKFRSARARASASNFRAFYQKQFARQVKSSVMQSGMLRSFQDMFASMDPDNKGWIKYSLTLTLTNSVVICL